MLNWSLNVTADGPIVRAPAREDVYCASGLMYVAVLMTLYLWKLPQRSVKPGRDDGACSIRLTVSAPPVVLKLFRTQNVRL